MAAALSHRGEGADLARLGIGEGQQIALARLGRAPDPVAELQRLAVLGVAGALGQGQLARIVGDQGVQVFVDEALEAGPVAARAGFRRRRLRIGAQQQRGQRRSQDGNAPHPQFLPCGLLRSPVILP